MAVMLGALAVFVVVLALLSVGGTACAAWEAREAQRAGRWFA